MRRYPTRGSYPINVEPKEAKDEYHSDAELQGVVKERKNGQAGGSVGMRAEDIKGWLCGMEWEEESGNAEARDTLR